MKKLRNVNYSKWVALSLAAIIVLYIFIMLINSMIEAEKSLNENLPINYEISSEDSTIFSSSVWGRLVVGEVFPSKMRNPISYLELDRSYDLIMYKIDLESEKHLSETLFLTPGKDDVAVGLVYHTTNNGVSKFQRKAGVVRPTSKILVTFWGDSIKIVMECKNFVEFRLLARTISVKYGENEPVDLHFKLNNIGDKLPINLAFLKRNNQVTLLILASNKFRNRIPPQTLNSLLDSRICDSISPPAGRRYLSN